MSDADSDLSTTVRLVGAAKRGDAEALDALLARYLPRVRQIVALRMGRRLRQVADLEDLVQDSMLKVLQGIDRFEQRSEGTFRNWLARCVECQIVDRVRGAGAKKRGQGHERRFGDYDREVLHSSIFAGREPTPSEYARANELGSQIEAALLEMPDHYRELIIQRSVCGMSYAEIASEMGFAQETGARMAFSRALQKLKERLGLDSDPK